MRARGALAASTCDGNPCWKTLGPPATPTGFKYSNRTAAPGASRTIILKSGTSPLPKAIWKSKGAGVDDAPLTLVPPVVVEVSNTDTGVCLGDSYDGFEVLTNDSAQFRARAVNP